MHNPRAHQSEGWSTTSELACSPLLLRAQTLCSQTAPPNTNSVYLLSSVSSRQEEKAGRRCGLCSPPCLYTGASTELLSDSTVQGFIAPPHSFSWTGTVWGEGGGVVIKPRTFRCESDPVLTPVQTGEREHRPHLLPVPSSSSLLLSVPLLTKQKAVQAL